MWTRGVEMGAAPGRWHDVGVLSMERACRAKRAQNWAREGTYSGKNPVGARGSVSNCFRPGVFYVRLYVRKLRLSLWRCASCAAAAHAGYVFALRNRPPSRVTDSCLVGGGDPSRSGVRAFLL